MHYLNRYRTHTSARITHTPELSEVRITNNRRLNGIRIDRLLRRPTTDHMPSKATVQLIAGMAFTVCVLVLYFFATLIFA
ncbi:hypothetical protein [Spirosoma sp.]|uniref:hypothetical protein n=1 Tax=Spirosoma sp. TaxID=1899569 RepID=UPI002627FC6E|nr:hypothetical protein [Spirosoma sp.]MCX6217696.1 hypothetical protein [Spirosoma sp.]